MTIGLKSDLVTWKGKVFKKKDDGVHQSINRLFFVVVFNLPVKSC